LSLHPIIGLTQTINCFSQISDGYTQIDTPFFSCETYGIPQESSMFDGQTHILDGEPLIFAELTHF
jgi:hypothetical protein